jgi:ATP-dependent phosphoenolpyruvate carboxykinase
MKQYGLMSSPFGLDEKGIYPLKSVFWNPGTVGLMEFNLSVNQSGLGYSFALMCDTGKFSTTGICISYNMAMICAALNGALNHKGFNTNTVFRSVPSKNRPARKANSIAAGKLAGQFLKNFKKFSGLADKTILKEAPQMLEMF